MIGLKEQIEFRRDGKILNRYEPVSYANISKIINKSHTQTKHKVETNSFSVKEAIKIYEALGFNPKEDYETFKYLFTEVVEDWRRYGID
jgi:hypothetical protein